MTLTDREKATLLGARILDTLWNLGLRVFVRSGHREVPQSDIAIAVAALFPAHPSAAEDPGSGAKVLRDLLDRTRGAVVTVAQWDSWALDWLAKNEPEIDAALHSDTERETR